MDVDDSRIQSLRHVSRLLVRELGMIAESYLESGLSNSQCHAVVELDHKGEMSSGELAEVLRTDKSNGSRTLSSLAEMGLVESALDPKDGRKKVYRLTEAGATKKRRVDDIANGQVRAALGTLQASEQEWVLKGISVYAKALARARLQGSYSIRPISSQDDPIVKRIIRSVLPEYDAVGSGFAFVDKELDCMSAAYSGSRAGFFVVEHKGQVVGCGGFASLEGGDKHVCELRKMYFLPSARGLGLGAMVLEQCLSEAKSAGFTYCYLETLERMHRAQRLYRGFGFEKLPTPMGDTGHYGCNAWFGKEL